MSSATKYTCGWNRGESAWLLGVIVEIFTFAHSPHQRTILTYGY